jgi:flagella basal body P-ring formation protein FlgA
MNPRPIMSQRKAVQLMVVLTILAWATQTLFAQWGRGGLILPQTTPLGGAPVATLSGATVELRSRVKFDAEGKVTVRDLCKWSDNDAALMEPYADVLVTHVADTTGVRVITIADLKARLHDAGANLSTMHFTGSSRCAVITGAATEDQIAAAAEKQAQDAFELTSDTATTPAVEQADPLLAEAAAPTTQPAEAEPQVIYEEQLVLTRPLSRGQRIIATDLVIKRVAVDAPTTRPAITSEQVVGTQLTRAMKKGDVLELTDFKAPPVVTAGQFMTVAMRLGEMEIETVAKAMSAGAAGDVIKAKNEANGDVYRVLVTAPNAGRIAPEAATDVVALPQN